MLHCLVFKEQLCLSKLSLQATYLLYRISFRLSRTFYFSFLSESSAPARRFQSRSIFLPGRCLAATCIILQDAQPFVNRYLELFFKNLHAASDVLRFTMIRKKHRFRDAHLHMAGVAGLEPTHAGFRDPCLTNLAIPLCLSTFIYYTDEYGICQPISFIFFQAYLLHFHSCIVIIYLTNEQLLICW